jgi:hypothetical protein
MKFNTVSRSLIVALLGSALVITPALVFAQDSESHTSHTVTPVSSAVDVQIRNDGKVAVHGAKVTGISGTTITAQTVWGSTTLAWTVNTNSSTKFLRRSDSGSSVAEISVGDYLDFNGTLDTTQAGLVVNASMVRDASIQKMNASFSGTVQSIATSTNSFALLTHNRGVVTVTTTSSTTITKGGATGFSAIMVGDKLTAFGLYDNNAHTLAASKIAVSVSEILQKHTFEGKLQSAIGTTSLPTAFALIIGNTVYTVNVALNTPILGKTWATINLGSFQAGDNVRVYGSVEANNLTTIDAVVVRDASR